MLLFRSWLALIWLITNSEPLSNSNSKCILNSTVIWCITMHSVTDVTYINNVTSRGIYPYFGDCDGNSTYYYYHYKMSQTISSSSPSLIEWPSSTHCFDGTTQLSLCINIGETHAYSSLYNFHKWSIIPRTISIPIYNTDFNRISLTNYQSISQCIEIIKGNFPLNNARSNYYFIRGYMLRSSNDYLSQSIESIWNTYNDLDPTQIMKISTSSSDINDTRFNELFCFASTSSADKYIHIELELVSVFDDKYSIYPLTKTIIDSTQYTESLEYTLPLINHSISFYLNIVYWERCNMMDYFAYVRRDEQTTSDNEEIASVSAILSEFSWYFLMCISLITIVIITGVSIGSATCYPAGDPINYFALVWMVLELWDFWSDVSFTVYLYIIFTFYGDSYIIFFILMIVAIVCVVVPYILNIFYFNHLVTLWSKDLNCCKAPQIWLSNGAYYIYFLMVALITGSVFPSIELSNSLLIPHPIFAMRVPYFELVRVRTERFITNVLFENFPFLILQIIFYYSIKSLHSFVLMKTVGGFVFLGTVLSSVLSILFNGTYYFSYKGKISLPIAIYRLGITLECDECSEYWQYSIWRMQTAISKAFGVSSPTLIMIDSCSISGESKQMKICCRLLYDESPFGNRMNIRLLLENRNVESVTRHITDLFYKEFVNKPLDEYCNPSLRCLFTTITEICGGEGELVYDYTQSKICNRCKDDEYKQNQRDVIQLYKAKQKKVKKNTKAHIRNVSDMKAAYSTSKKSSDISISRSLRPKKKKCSNLSVSDMEFNTKTHHRFDSNLSKTNDTLDVKKNQRKKSSRSYNKPLPSLTYMKPLPSYTPPSSPQVNNKDTPSFDPLTPPVNAMHNKNNISFVSLSPSASNQQSNIEIINEKDQLMLSLNAAQNVVANTSLDSD